MKLSSNSIGMLIFFALATAVFVLMALRPAVDGNAMNLGIPMTGEMTSTSMNTENAPTEVVVEKIEEKVEEIATENTAAEAEITETNTEESSATSEESTNSEASTVTEPKATNLNKSE